MKIVAHRGASAVAPENTMAAFRRAIEIGADGIEFDVQSTFDGQLVVIHDFTLDRTTNGHGAVFASTWPSIEGLDAGSWFSSEYERQRVPLLAEVLELSDVEFELELKGYGTEFLAQVLRTVDGAGVLDRVEFTSSNAQLVALLKSNVPTTRTGLFSIRQPDWMTDDVFEHHVIGVASTASADVAHVFAGDITRQIVDRLHTLGLTVHANDAETTEHVLRAVESGADRLSTTNVSLAVDSVSRPT